MEHSILFLQRELCGVVLLDRMRKCFQFLRIQRRDGPIGHASGGPLHEMVAVACHRGLWPSRSRGGRPAPTAQSPTPGTVTVSDHGTLEVKGKSFAISSHGLL